MQKKSWFNGVLDAKAFTLIELLVVVLIIGILAAVAVPQYQKAVEKTRNAIYLPILVALRDAQQVYFMSNNSYADSMSEIDVDVPLPNSLASSSCGNYVKSTDAIRSDDRVMIILNNASNVNFVSGIRISSKYRCAGWKIPLTDYSSLKANTVYCYEEGWSVVGDFCRKIYGASYVETVNGGRFYKMP